MRRLLLASALPALFATGAHADGSVLERVLGVVNNGSSMTQLNGVFANIAESVGVSSAGILTWVDSGAVPVDDIDALYQAWLDAKIATQIDLIEYRDGLYYVDDFLSYDTLDAATQGATDYAISWNDQNGGFDYFVTTEGYSQAVVGGLSSKIDGSITNALSGATEATVAVGGAVLAVQHVTVDVGDLSTTVLGAVNTGEITLGVNQGVTEAVAGSSSAVSSAITQLGGTTDTGALVLNVAANTSDILGSVSNTFDGLNGTVGNVATTVLGAVNTGTITSGINAAVEGIQSGIVGN